MAIEIVLTSLENDFSYFENLAYLRAQLQNGAVHFQGLVANYAPNAIVYENKARIYDFTRSASCNVRENLTTYLNGVLPELTPEGLARIRQAFDCLFNYYAYKGYLDQVGFQRHEAMRMLIFKQGQYVAHVTVSCTSRRTAPQQFTVDAVVTCQRFTYFPRQATDLDAVILALQNLHA